MKLDKNAKDKQTRGCITANQQDSVSGSDPTAINIEPSIHVFTIQKLHSHCNSCNRVEISAWRRGPDGTRTLCRACSLHYAKVYHAVNKDAGD